VSGYEVFGGGVRNGTAPLKEILWQRVMRMLAKSYVLVDEEGTPVYVTEDEIAAKMFTVDFPGTRIVVAEECEVVSVEKERTC